MARPGDLSASSLLIGGDLGRMVGRWHVCVKHLLQHILGQSGTLQKNGRSHVVQNRKIVYSEITGGEVINSII